MSRSAKISKENHPSIVARWKAGRSKMIRSAIVKDMASEFRVSTSMIYVILKVSGISPKNYVPAPEPSAPKEPVFGRPIIIPEAPPPRPAVRFASVHVGVRVDLLTRGTGRPHYAPLRLPPLQQHAKET